mmetsp:Transcript_5244/g.12627  ORF Transcript_5244/g.12627 Transcript_5244/m.12627 type:complete len:652 (-) Transcript_5244:136-2091(-)
MLPKHEAADFIAASTECDHQRAEPRAPTSVTQRSEGVGARPVPVQTSAGPLPSSTDEPCTQVASGQCGQHGEPSASSQVAARSTGRINLKLLRTAAQRIKAGQLDEFYQTLSVSAFQEAQVSVTLSKPDEPDCPLIAVSDGFERMTGYSRAEILGQNCRFLSRGCTVPAAERHKMRIAVRTGKSFSGVLQNRRKNGEVFFNLLHMTSLRVGTKIFILGIQADVTTVSVDVAKAAHRAELERIVNSIFAAHVDAWAALQLAHYQTLKLSRTVPYADLLLQHSDSEQFEKARDAFVAVEPDLIQNHFACKNTFLEVTGSEEDPMNVLMGLRAVWSEPRLVTQRSDDDDDEDTLQPWIPSVFPSRPLLMKATSSSEKFDHEEHGLDSKSPSKDFDDADPKHDEALGMEATELDIPSMGSLLHPDDCRPCSFFCYSLVGCNRGKACKFCHMEHPRKGRRRGKKKGRDGHGSLQGGRDQGDQDWEEVPLSQAPVKPEFDAKVDDGLLPLLSALELLSPLPPPVLTPSRGRGSNAAAKAEMLELDYSEPDVVLFIGHPKKVIPFLLGAGRGTPTFVVKPPLPLGLELDPMTGVISGVVFLSSICEESFHSVTVECDGSKASSTIHIRILDHARVLADIGRSYAPGDCSSSACTSEEE